MGDGTGTHDKVTSLDSPGKTEQGAVNTRIKIDCQQDNQVSVSLSVYEFVQEEAPNSQHPDRFNHDVDSDFVSDFVQNFEVTVRQWFDIFQERNKLWSPDSGLYKKYTGKLER